jgi:hypothetical protein
MKLTVSLLSVILLPSCGLIDSMRGISANETNASALFDPPTVTLRPSTTYDFAEGTLEGRGQKFHSDYSYRRAIIIGNESSK